MESPFDDHYYMKKAIAEAELAFEKDEVPVGALIVSKQQIIAKSHNLTELLCDVTAHAEMQAKTAAANYLGAKYLRSCTLYVTLEPCQMCAGALYWSQIGKVVYAAEDPKRGYRAMGANLHPKTQVEFGVLGRESRKLSQEFFDRKRL